jgi:tol-pal system protein YbgF
MIRRQAQSILLFLALTAPLTAPLGCSRGSSAEERQMSELRDEITRVQAESDKFEQRLDKLEVESADVRTDARPLDAPPTTTRSLSAPIVTPPLRVVHLGPDGLEESGASAPPAPAAEADPNDSSPRPRIKIQGTGAEATITTEKGGKPRKLRNDRIDETLSPDDASASSLSAHASGRPSALDADAKRAYDAALGLVSSKHYAEALDALAGFLVRWPDHPNADNAMYWRGECYFAQGEYAQAAAQFEGVIARFPLGNKLPDALLKLGLSQAHLGNPQVARQEYDRLRHDFPHSDAARHIPESAPLAQPATAPAPRSTSGENP